jgi:hypothetical protein
LPAIRVNAPIAIELVLSEARRYVGVEEKPRGSNRGIQVDYWNWEAIGDWRPFPMGGQAAPWCASFVSQVGIQALGRRWWPIPQTAIAHAIFQWGEAANLAMSTPHRGDVFCCWYERYGRYGHVGFVVETFSDGYATVEGNANSGGGREGYVVMERKRKLAERTAFVRWAGVLDGGTSDEY